MSDRQPIIPPSTEVIFEQARANAGQPSEKYRGNDENTDNIRDRAKSVKKLGESVSKLAKDTFSDWVQPTEGASYVNDQYTINRIKQLIGNPTTQEEFEKLLEEYISRIEQNPNRENFEERIPILAYMQGQKKRLTLSDASLHDEHGMFVLRDRRAEIAELRRTTEPLRNTDGTLQLSVTKEQVILLRSYEDRRMRNAQDAEFLAIISHVDNELTDEDIA